MCFFVLVCENMRCDGIRSGTMISHAILHSVMCCAAIVFVRPYIFAAHSISYISIPGVLSKMYLGISALPLLRQRKRKDVEYKRMNELLTGLGIKK